MPLGNPTEFDRWAESYDAPVNGGVGFPFAGYERVLSRLVALTEAEPSHSVLDLGIGTGNLALPFVELGCDVSGLDFSSRMLELAAVKIPHVKLGQAEILGPWPDAFRVRYDRIVSAYVFHHFDPAEKVGSLGRLIRDHVAPGGRITVADLAFFTTADLDHAREEWAQSWDEEHYWVVDRDVAACKDAGLDVRYEPIVEFAGVFTVVRSGGDGAGAGRHGVTAVNARNPR
jgi:putative AdoMet-dependent methyltransferase